MRQQSIVDGSHKRENRYVGTSSDSGGRKPRMSTDDQPNSIAFQSKVIRRYSALRTSDLGKSGSRIKRDALAARDVLPPRHVVKSNPGVPPRTTQSDEVAQL